MLKIMITGAVILKGKNETPAVKCTEVNGILYASFRIAVRLYDPKAENHTKWLYLAVKTSRWMADRIQKMQMESGQRINIDGSLEEDVWIGDDGRKNYMLYVSPTSIERCEKGQFVRLFGTQMYISKGNGNVPGVRYTENSAMFRLSHCIYDKSAENNRRWMNMSARAFGTGMKAMQNLSLDGGSCINFWGRLDVSNWKNEAGEPQTAYQIIVEEIEPAKQKEQPQTGFSGMQGDVQTDVCGNQNDQYVGAYTPQYQAENTASYAAPVYTREQAAPNYAPPQYAPSNLTYMPGQNCAQTGGISTEDNDPFGNADNPFAEDSVDEPAKAEPQPRSFFLGYEVFGGKSPY